MPSHRQKIAKSGLTISYLVALKFFLEMIRALSGVERDVLLLPMTVSRIVLTYNLPNVESRLKVPRAVEPEMLLDQMKRWDDVAIAKANPAV